MTVPEILNNVRDRGTEAVLEYTARFDGVKLTADQLVWNPLAEPARAVDPKLAEAIDYAMGRIHDFHQQTRPENTVMEPEPGVRLEERFIPLSRVGVYVPNGSFPLVSTLLMTAVPALVAGVKDVVVAISPRRAVRNSALWTHILQRLGISQVLLAGGAQAIAALAYGLEDFRSVDLIAGPGNRYVAEAKQEVARRGVAGIDLLAGPSEVMVIADDMSLEDFVMADLLAQAEHDLDARAEFVTRNVAFAERIGARLKTIPGGLGPITVTVAPGAADLVRIANERAPEHLGLMGAEVESLADQIWAAGAIFIGPMAGQAFGDYVAGPSHVLPTGGTGRFQSGLSTRTFLKRVSVIQAGPETSSVAYRHAAVLANLEGLVRHEASMTLREAYLKRSQER